MRTPNIYKISTKKKNKEDNIQSFNGENVCCLNFKVYNLITSHRKIQEGYAHIQSIYVVQRSRTSNSCILRSNILP